MAEKNNIEKPSKNQDSSQDPPLQATSSSSRELKKEKQGTIRESKRRKGCPTALDRIEESIPPNFSFTFDTQFSTYSQEFTPKFGSFNSAPSTKERLDDTVLCFHQSSENKEGRHEDKQRAGVSEERVAGVSTLRRSIDGIREKK